ncbi:hypothetical protein PQX77_001755 [Marasmius sp. AFHP31]|nr:hypothetical protein PQX77_001755 [Marasmius sp. AFHP31]
MKCASAHHIECLNLTSKPSILIAVAFLLYGIYTVLYGLCMYILHARKRDHYKVHFALITALYVVCTIALGLKVVIYALESPVDLLEYTLNLPVFALEQLPPEQEMYLNDLKQALRIEYET